MQEAPSFGVLVFCVSQLCQNAQRQEEPSSSSKSRSFFTEVFGWQGTGKELAEMI